MSLDYPLLFKISKALLALPYSTTIVESTSSEFQVIKTPYRNRLSTENLEASLLSEQHFKKGYPFALPDMIDRYFSMWKNVN